MPTLFRANRAVGAVWMAIGILVWGTATGRSVTLEECIRASLEASPELQAASHRLQASRELMAQSASAYYPWLGLSSALERTDNPPEAFMMNLNQRSASLSGDFNNPDDTENLLLGANLKYRVFDGGRRSLDHQMAGLGARAAFENKQSTQNDLVYQVTRSYYGALQAQAFVGVQEESVKTLEESLRVANERLKAGSAVQTDALNLEVKLAQAREDLIRANNGVRLAIAVLNTVIGRDVATSTNLPPPTLAVSPPPPSTTDVTAVVGGRPEWRAAHLMAKADEKNASKAERDYLPTVSAFGGMDWNSDVSSDFERSYRAGLMAEWNVFTGFYRSHAVAATRARWRAAQADERKMANQLKLDLTQAQLMVGEAWERIQVTQKSVQTAEEAHRITRERYQQGAADLTELLTAQAGLTATRTRKVAAYYDYQTALSNLARARGELVEQHTGQRMEE